MKTKPKILITNDDGIDAPGIRHLWNALKDHADLTVVAPSHEQSATGLSITIRQPLHIRKVEWSEGGNAWSVSGTPADCVKLALNVVLSGPPDLIVSGINRGSNAGRNVFYSGTVAGAIEGVMHDIPSIAFSCQEFKNPNFLLVESYVPSIVDYVLTNPMPKGTLLNVNFPKLDNGAIKGFRMTRQGQEFWIENPDMRTHPLEGSAYYWLGAKLAEFDEHEDSDITWLKKGYLTAVPVHVGELTDHVHLSASKNAFERLLAR